jgi:hypothetical protein
MDKKIVLARLTVEREVGVKTIIEVHADATFQTFYHYYTQDGRRRGTKRLVRKANRNEGLYPWHQAYRMRPGLDVIAAHFRQMPHVAKVTVRIIRKRAYRKVLEAAPDALGPLTRTVSRFEEARHWERGMRCPVYIPSAFTPMKKRFEILSGR